MTRKHWSNDRLTLFNYAGERKYLSKAERLRFLKALPVLKDEKERSFVELLFWTGARPSEGLALTAIQVDVDESMIIFRSLKKRKKENVFRAVPVPPEFMQRLAKIHDIAPLQATPDRGESAKLWNFKRTTAFKRVRMVMDEAGILGVKSSARGLRHGFAVSCATNYAPQSTIQRWLGHSHIGVSSVYLEMAAPQDHEIAARMWRGLVG